MTKSVYVCGGAGTGKSTFTAALLEGLEFGPLEAFHARRNAKALVTLRGHRLPGNGLYLGVMRPTHPGSDGLDRATSPTGAEWLAMGNLPEWIIGEGATLATKPFLIALAENTDLLLLHLTVDPFVADLRFLTRGTNQDPKFVVNTVTRSANLATYMADRAEVSTVNTDDPSEWDAALKTAKEHLGVARCTVV